MKPILIAKQELVQRMARCKTMSQPLDLRDIRLDGVDLTTVDWQNLNVPILLSEGTLKGSIVDQKALRHLKPYIVQSGASLANSVIVGDVKGKVRSDPTFAQQIIYYFDLGRIDFTNVCFKGDVSYVSFVGADLTGATFEGGLHHPLYAIKDNSTAIATNLINKSLLKISSLTSEQAVDFIRKIFMESHQDSHAPRRSYVSGLVNSLQDIFTTFVPRFKAKEAKILSNIEEACATTMETLTTKTQEISTTVAPFASAVQRFKTNEAATQPSKSLTHSAKIATTNTSSRDICVR